MNFVARTLHAYGTRVKRAFPLLVVATVVLDVLLLGYIEPAPPLVIAFWLGVYVASTFLILTALYVFWVYLTGGARAGSMPRGERTSQ